LLRRIAFAQAKIETLARTDPDFESSLNERASSRQGQQRSRNREQRIMTGKSANPNHGHSRPAERNKADVVYQAATIAAALFLLLSAAV
jgi:hypothetical protein